jgi:hypothetical protein
VKVLVTVVVAVVVPVAVETYCVDVCWAMTVLVDVVCVGTVVVATKLVDVSVCVVDVVSDEVATTLDEVTNTVDVPVTVTGTVVTVAPVTAPKSSMLPTAHPSVDETIQTAFSGSITLPIGSANTRAHVNPFQNRMIGSVPSTAPTIQPSVADTM